MKKFLESAFTDGSSGTVSSMRIMFALAVLTFLAGYVVILWGTVYVILKTNQFPPDFWTSIASLSGGTVGIFGAKGMQTMFESRRVVTSTSKESAHVGRSDFDPQLP